MEPILFCDFCGHSLEYPGSYVIHMEPRNMQLCRNCIDFITGPNLSPREKEEILTSYKLVDFQDAYERFKVSMRERE